jgi:hypothetical protein
MVVLAGSDYETQRGALCGSAGAASKGVRVVDGSGDEVPGFARMQADDGTYYSPAVASTLTINGMVAGSRLLIRRTDTQAALYNDVPGTSYAYNYVWSSNIPVEIVVRKATSAPYYIEWTTTATLTATSNSVTVNQSVE